MNLPMFAGANGPDRASPPHCGSLGGVQMLESGPRHFLVFFCLKYFGMTIQF